MISILIPVYNYNITKLVFELHKQASEIHINFEIIVVDDFSFENIKAQNRSIKELTNIKYEELNQNIGRSKIRNYLVKKSQYPYLMIMDCDVQIVKPDFVKSYINECKGEVAVCGGTVFTPKKPKETNLRWKYGTKRESRPANIRNLNPNHNFSTLNFMVSKSIFSNIWFNEDISMYGHEDTLFGYELKKHGIQITHIDNELLHLGLDSNRNFMLKTKQSIKTLNELLCNPSVDKHFADDVKILRMYKTLKKYNLHSSVSVIFKLIYLQIEYYLIHISPNLKLFDFYKIGYLCSLQKKSTL